MTQAVQRRTDVGELLDRMPFGAHGSGDRCEARVVEIHAEESVAVEVDVILLFRTPLAIVEDHRRHRNLLAHAGQDLAKAHAPGTVADVGDRRTIRRRGLAADDGGKSIAAVAEHHRAEHAAWPIEAQIAVGDLADVADVGRDHGLLGHRLLELAQHLARMHVLRSARHFDAPRVFLAVPAVELLFPGVPRVDETRDALVAIRGAGEPSSLQPCDDRERRLAASPQTVTVVLTRPSTGSAST